MKDAGVTNRRKDIKEVGDSNGAFPPVEGTQAVDQSYQLIDCRGRLKAQKNSTQATSLGSSGATKNGRTCAMMIVSLRGKAVRLQSQWTQTWCPKLMQSEPGTTHMWSTLCKAMDTLEDRVGKILNDVQQEMQSKDGLELLLWTWQHVDCREQVLIQDDFASFFGIPMWELIHALEEAEAKQECAVDDPYMEADADTTNNAESINKASTGGHSSTQPPAHS